MRLPDRNIAALLMIYRKINAWRSEHAAPLGLSSSQVTIIIETCKNSGISQTELVKRLSHEKSVVAKAIAKLIAAGYVFLVLAAAAYFLTPKRCRWVTVPYRML